MTEIEVHDSGDLRKYRTEIPNLICELGLSPHALTLYVHLKRTCGTKGKCWKSTKTLAEDTQMSAGKVSQTRAELEAHNLITIERPKDKTQPVVVRITDVWLKNFEHFSRVHNMNTSRSQYETKKEPLEERTDESTSVPSVLPRAKPKKGSVLPLDKHTTDQLYDAMKATGLRWDQEEYSYHLGRVQDMLRNDDPTEEEIEALPEALKRVYALNPTKADAPKALREMRRQKMRDEITAGWEKDKERDSSDSAQKRTAGYEWLFDRYSPVTPLGNTTEERAKLLAEYRAQWTEEEDDDGE